MKNKKTYKSLQKDIRTFKTPKIDIWRNQYPDKDYKIDIKTNEFTCMCPKTGLPDFASLQIQYTPDKWCVELKSFKLYLVSFRKIGIFHEHIVNRVLDDFVKASRPRWVSVQMVFNPRGGITTTVNAEYKK